MSGFDLMFDLKAGEQGHIIAVSLDASHIVGHHHRHKGFRLLVDFFGVDEDFTDIRREIITDGSNHQTRFKINEHRRFIVICC